MGELKIEITGPGAEDAERELYELLRAEFGVEGRRVASDAGEHEPGRKTEPNTLAIIAILVALPSTIVATLDLAKRIELTQKVKHLIAWARGRSTPCQCVYRRPRARAGAGSTSRRSRASDLRRIFCSTSTSQNSRERPAGRNSPSSRRPS